MLFSLNRYISVYLVSLILDLFPCYQKLVQQLGPHPKNKNKVSLLFSCIWQKSNKTAINRKFCGYSYNFNQCLILKLQPCRQNLVCVFLQLYLLHLYWLLEKEMTAHSSILAWRISWTKGPGRLQSMGSQTVGHNWATNTYTLIQTLLLQ